MVDNPSKHSRSSSSVSATSFPPWRQIRELQTANKQLKLQMESAKSESFHSSERRLSSEVVSHADSGSIDTTKVNARLKEVFKEKIAQYREAVYLLTGYRIDLLTVDSIPRAQTRLRLRSMYGERPEDAIEFMWRDQVTLELLDSPFVSDHLDQRFLRYLQASKSVPAFLASVTLDLQEKQTLA